MGVISAVRLEADSTNDWPYYACFHLWVTKDVPIVLSGHLPIMLFTQYSYRDFLSANEWHNCLHLRLATAGSVYPIPEIAISDQLSTKT